jgi:hypothetical protein
MHAIRASFIFEGQCSSRPTEVRPIGNRRTETAKGVAMPRHAGVFRPRASVRETKPTPR